MGMWIHQCAITGVPVSDVVVVLLDQDRAKRFVPCSLPIWGHVDGYGRLERIKVDASSRRLMRGVRQALDTKVIEIDLDGLDRPGLPLDATPQGLGAFVETLSLDALDRRHVRCEGRRLTCAMIAMQVYDAIARKVRPKGKGVDSATVLGDGEPARTLYAGSTLAKSAGQFDAVLRWLAARKLTLRPIDKGSQFGEDDYARLVLKAGARFRDQPVLLQGLLAYTRWEIDGWVTLKDLVPARSWSGSRRSHTGRRPTRRR